MFWYWKIRIYNSQEHYVTTWVATARKLGDIDLIQDSYLIMTGCKMSIEGMSDQRPGTEHNPWGELTSLPQAYNMLWKPCT